MQFSHKLLSAGKSFSDALILAQYDERLFIELQEKYKLRTCCVQKLYTYWMGASDSDLPVLRSVIDTILRKSQK